MSRRTIALLSVFFAVLVIANVIVLAIWLPNRKPSANAVAPANLTAAAPVNAAAAGVTAGNTTAVAAAGSTVRPQPKQPPAGFALERQVPSASGNLQIKYLRDRSTKVRRIAVEDVHRPDGGVVLCESKRSAWALVSPDDQWIVVAERSATGDGNVQLYHRSNNSSVQFAPTQENAGTSLQDVVWKAYLSATEADPNTPRRGATINATAWENDSRKVDLSVAYLPGPNNPDVPAPWSCTYDVASKQVEPVNVPAGDRAEGDETAAPEQQGSDQGATKNPFADNSTESQTDEAADNDFPGEKFPATRLDELTVPDVNESSLDEINYAINEMYARHGVDFKDKKVSNQFSEFSWYKPRTGVTVSEAEGEFSDLEKGNLKTLQRCRDAKVAAANRKSHPAHRQKAEEESTGDKVLRGLRQWQEMGAPMPPHP
jgi:hypothetical protein